MVLAASSTGRFANKLTDGGSLGDFGRLRNRVEAEIQ